MADQDWMQSLAKLIENLLGAGTGGTIGSGVAGTWGIFREARPSAKDKNGELIILSSNPGNVPFSNVAGLRRYEFEVRTVSPEGDEGAAKAKADEIYNLLGVVQGSKTSPDGRVFDFFEILSTVDRDDIDATGHFEYAFPVRTQVRE